MAGRGFIYKSFHAPMGLTEEQELTEEQMKRKAQVQFKAQYYSQEDWDIIRAKLEANAELKRSIIGAIETSGIFEPISFETTKEELKRFGKELQSKVVKKQKITHDEPQETTEKTVEEVKEEKTPKKTGKRIKQIARRDKEVDFEILDSRFPIIDWKSVHIGTQPQFDESKEPGEINQNMITRSNGAKENIYPLERNVLSQMLDLKLQAEEESETALELIRFIKKQFEEMDLKRIEGDEKYS
ncbi:hypothetical protein Tco_0185208 [Tanacetum coccineum]